MDSYDMKTPVGLLRLLDEGQGLAAILWPQEHNGKRASRGQPPASLAPVVQQLQEYFAGRRRSFDLDLAPTGTAFQRQVWGALRQIPYGEVRSYAEIARSIGRDKAVRAVGAANGRNPLPIVVPCHRVIGSDGSLTGFAGGLTAKRLLLELEGALPDAA